MGGGYILRSQVATARGSNRTQLPILRQRYAE
jgi:hypothetical protein